MEQTDYSSKYDTPSEKQIVSVDEYRKILNDYTTPDKRIQERIDYLIMFTHKIARGELEKYVEKKR